MLLYEQSYDTEHVNVNRKQKFGCSVAIGLRATGEHISRTLKKKTYYCVSFTKWAQKKKELLKSK